jgi:hypothetical protein
MRQRVKRYIPRGEMSTYTHTHTHTHTLTHIHKYTHPLTLVHTHYTHTQTHFTCQTFLRPHTQTHTQFLAKACSYCFYLSDSLDVILFFSLHKSKSETFLHPCYELFLSVHFSFFIRCLIWVG